MAASVSDVDSRARTGLASGAGVTSAFESGNSGDAGRIGHLLFRRTRICRTKLWQPFRLRHTFRSTSKYHCRPRASGGSCWGARNTASTPRGHPARRFVSIVAFRRKSARGAQVDLAVGKRGQLLVGRLFLVERLLQDAGAIVAAELLCPRDQAAVARDLVT